MEFMTAWRTRSGNLRERGNALILALMMVMVLTGISTTQYLMTSSNLRQSTFYIEQGNLDSYAETGVSLALHDLRYDVTGEEGKIGTTAWTTADDLGEDGLAATQDPGEDDGIPTPGEPNVVPVSIGATEDEIQIFTYTVDSAYAATKRIVATAVSGDNYAMVEAYAKSAATGSLPHVAAIYVDPSVVLDLKGNNFTISGIDTNPDGSAGPEAELYGISTAEAATPGENANDLIDQIAANRQDQVIGAGATDPSIGESTEVIDIDALFANFQGKADRTVGTGTHSNVSWGNSSNYEITYASGDLQLTGTGTGAGILLVDGSLHMSGQFTWEGLVIVRGDVRQTGGGSGTHVYGTLMMSSTFSLIDDPDLTVTGSADIVYSSEAINKTQTMLNSKPGNAYAVLYRDVLR